MFKNAITYLVTPVFCLNPEILARFPARPCAPHESRTMGFTAPCNHSTDKLAHHVSGYTLICLETEDRLLPCSVVAEEVEQRAIDLEKLQGYKPGRKQMRELKERVTAELLPKAFTQKRLTLGVFAGKYFMVDTSSPARADLMLKALRSALDVLPLAHIQTQQQITGAMIQWLLGTTPHGLTVDDCVELEKAESGNPTITYKRTMIDENDMYRRIRDDGYVPRKIGITLSDRLSFKVDSRLHLNQLTMLELMQLDSRDRRDQAEDVAQAFDADVTLMVGELVSTMNRLINELGGLAQPEKDLLTVANNPAQPEDSDDDLYMDAAAIVIKNQRASISFVQRHLRIGYNRAARLIEDMERSGIVSPMDSSGSRKVLVTADAMKAAGQALRELDEMAKADSTTITLEHNGEVLATFGKESA
jgi:recombination associated protein RdgC